METVTNERRHYDGNKIIHQEFSVCQVEDYSFVNLDSEYSFIGKTDEEKSLVCLTSEVPPNVIRYDDGWKALRIQGVLEFSLIGILSKIAAILADHNIPIFAVSSFKATELFTSKYGISFMHLGNSSIAPASIPTLQLPTDNLHIQF